MRRLLPPCVLVAAVLSTGCGGGIDQRKFERLKLGMTPQDVEAILGKGGKEVTSDEVAALMREALGSQAPAGKSATTAAKIESPDLSNTRGVRWGDDSKSVTVIYTGGRVSRIFKKGF